jgi:serine/threonine protein kinase
LASTSTPGKRGYIAPEIFTSKEASPKSDVYSFGVLLIQLVNEIPFILDGYEIDIHCFIKWAQKVHVQKDGFKDIIDYVVINNSIVGFNHNEAKLILQISLKCIQEEPNQRPEMKEVLQMLEKLNKQEGARSTTTIIQNLFNILRKRFALFSIN